MICFFVKERYRKATVRLVIRSFYQKSNLTLVSAVAFLMFIFFVGLYDTDERNNYADNCYNNAMIPTRISSINFYRKSDLTLGGAVAFLMFIFLWICMIRINVTTIFIILRQYCISRCNMVSYLYKVNQVQVKKQRLLQCVG